MKTLYIKKTRDKKAERPPAPKFVSPRISIHLQSLNGDDDRRNHCFETAQHARANTEPKGRRTAVAQDALFT